MAKKMTNVILRLPLELKEQFFSACRDQEKGASEVIRALMEREIKRVARKKKE